MPRIDSRPHKNDGERLRRIRGILGLSQKQLAHILGCCRKTVGNYERAITEIPQTVRRHIFALAGVDIVPIHSAEEDPEIVVRKFYELRKNSNIEVILAQKGIKPTLVARFRRFREFDIYRQRHKLTRTRRLVENTLSFTYFVAIFTFANETFHRSFGNQWAENQVYHDVLYLGSLGLIGMLTVTMIQSIPWGTKQGA